MWIGQTLFYETEGGWLSRHHQLLASCLAASAPGAASLAAAASWSPVASCCLRHMLHGS